MKRLRFLGAGVRCDSVRHILVASITYACLSHASPAQAELGADFQGKVTVDPEWATGVSGPTDVAFAGDGRAVITRKNGEITIRRANGAVTTVSNVFPNVDGKAGERGLLGVVADPSVATNNTFYFYVSNGMTSDDKHRVLKAVLTEQNTFTVDPTPVIAASRNNGPGLAGPANHNGGGLFIHKNQLYIGVGDTGQNSSPPTNKYGSCLNVPNGKILRVNLDGSVPQDNPLVGKASATSCSAPKGTWGTGAPDTRIYAWGLRNPWRLWVDSQTDLMWIGDVGENQSEEISVGKGGQHFGFPFVEGSVAHGDVDGMNCAAMSPPTACTPPIHAWAWNEGGGKGSSTGGLIPTGCGWDKALGGTRYLYADYVKNWVRAITVNAQRTGVTGMPAAFDTYKSAAGPVSFRMGPDEALYIVYYEADAVYRYAPTDRTGCANGGTGGAGGTGSGGGASAGSPAMAGSPTGGTAPTGGTSSSGASGMNATAGSPSPSAGSGGTSTVGGSPAAAGTNTSGAPSQGGAPAPVAGSINAAGAAGGGAKDDGGCGCRVAGGNTRLSIGSLLLAGLAAGAWRRRRRSAERSRK